LAFPFLNKKILFPPVCPPSSIFWLWCSTSSLPFWTVVSLFDIKYSLTNTRLSGLPQHKGPMAPSPFSNSTRFNVSDLLPSLFPVFFNQCYGLGILYGIRLIYLLSPPPLCFLFFRQGVTLLGPILSSLSIVYYPPFWVFCSPPLGRNRWFQRSLGRAGVVL